MAIFVYFMHTIIWGSFREQESSECENPVFLEVAPFGRVTVV